MHHVAIIITIIMILVHGVSLILLNMMPVAECSLWLAVDMLCNVCYMLKLLRLGLLVFDS